jgi:hypothetical protein
MSNPTFNDADTALRANGPAGVFAKTRPGPQNMSEISKADPAALSEVPPFPSKRSINEWLHSD